MINLKINRPQFDTESQKYNVNLFNDINNVKINIFISKVTAQEILLSEDNIELEDSNIYQTLSQVLIAYEIKIDKIEIIFKNNKYCALVEFSNFENNFFSNIVSISNALVLSARYSIPIVISELLSIELPSEKDKVIDEDLNARSKINKKIKLKKLRCELQKAINNEEYEVAALIRDKISELSMKID